MKKIFLVSLLLAMALPCFAASIKDARDGQKYKTVKIGNQEWMAQNLNLDAPNSWCYENKPANCKKYGRLYSWKAAKDACPAGWHLPSNEEFSALRNSVGGADAGKQLKSKKGWPKGTAGKDSFKFSALPAGFYNGNKDNFDFKDKGAYFWSSTESGCFGRDYQNILHSRDNITVNRTKYYGFSIRCVKD